MLLEATKQIKVYVSHISFVLEAPSVLGMIAFQVANLVGKGSRTTGQSLVVGVFGHRSSCVLKEANQEE